MLRLQSPYTALQLHMGEGGSYTLTFVPYRGGPGIKQYEEEHYGNYKQNTVLLSGLLKSDLSNYLFKDRTKERRKEEVTLFQNISDLLARKANDWKVYQIVFGMDEK